MAGAKRKKLQKQIEIDSKTCKLVEQKAKRKKERLITVVALISVAAIIGGCFFVNSIINKVKNTGNYLRKYISISSGDIKIDNTMMSYYFKNAYYTFMQSENFNNEFDITKDLHDQQYSENVSWYDYFMDIAVSRAEQAILFSLEAKENGLYLDESDNKKIEDMLAEIDPSNIKTGVKASDIRKCLELNQLADKYYQSVFSKVNTDEETIKEYVFSNIQEFQVVSYRTHTLTYEDESQDIAGMKKSVAENYVDSFKKLKNEKEFDKWLKSYFTDNFEDWTTADIEDQIQYTKYNNITKSTLNGEVKDWLFSDSTKKYETFVVNDSEHASFVVYMITKTKAINESKLQTVRHILLTNDVYDNDKETYEKAKEILKTYKSGKKTEKRFAELAEKYSEDPGSSSNGGIYENFAKGDMVEEFEKWCFNKERRTGDTGIVKTEYGYHIMYYVKNMPSWFETGKEKYLENWHEELLKFLKQKYPITKNEKNLQRIEQ